MDQTTEVKRTRRKSAIKAREALDIIVLDDENVEQGDDEDAEQTEVVELIEDAEDGEDDMLQEIAMFESIHGARSSEQKQNVIDLVDVPMDKELAMALAASMEDVKGGHAEVAAVAKKGKRRRVESEKQEPPRAHGQRRKRERPKAARAETNSVDTMTVHNAEGAPHDVSATDHAPNDKAIKSPKPRVKATASDAAEAALAVRTSVTKKVTAKKKKTLKSVKAKAGANADAEADTDADTETEADAEAEAPEEAADADMKTAGVSSTPPPKPTNKKQHATKELKGKTNESASKPTKRAAKGSTPRRRAPPACMYDEKDLRKAFGILGGNKSGYLNVATLLKEVERVSLEEQYDKEVLRKMLDYADELGNQDGRVDLSDMINVARQSAKYFPSQNSKSK